MNITNKITQLILILTIFCFSTQYENWRQPLYFSAAKGGYALTTPSSMFWDDLTGASVLDSRVWFSEEQLIKNHLIVEPAFQVGFLNQVPSGQDKYFIHGGLLNEIRFHNLLVRQTVDVDSRYEFDQDYPGHRDRGARGRIDEAYCQLDWKYGFFRLGRLNRNWGPFPDRSLVLSSNPYTYDALEWQIHSSVFEFRHLVAAFANPTNAGLLDADDGTQWNRYFAAHSLNVMLGGWVTAGITETVLFSRDKQFPDLQYVNPVSIYTVTNTNQEGDANLMLAFQWDIYPFTKKVALKGQLAFDDFQVDDEIATDKEPTHWGIDCGVFWYDPLPVFTMKHTIYSQFTTLSEWMYTVPDNNANRGERYTHFKKSIGYPENDVTHFNLGAQIIGNNFWLANCELGYSEKGEKSPLSRWNDHNTTPGLPFDTIPDIQKKMFEVSLNAHGYFRDYIDGWIGFNAQWIKNNNNIKTSSYEFEPIFQAGVSLHFSDCYVKLPQ